MILIAGLGNPGKQYEKTRHNVGFEIISDLRFQPAPLRGARPGISDFSDWEINKKFRAEIAEGKMGREKIILLKPQTFMNKSGEAVAAAARFYKIKPENIWVVHDDLDLPLGKIKIQKNRSAAGHKGVQSIIDHLGTKNFVRFRIGIAPLKPTRQKGADFVLSTFSKEEQETLKSIIKKANEAIALAVEKRLYE